MKKVIHGGKNNTFKDYPISYFLAIPIIEKLVFYFTSFRISTGNFGSKESYECFLAIKVEDTVFPVEGSDIDDHGDAHAEEGLCNVIHHAEVSGEFKNNVFYAESFNLVNIN